MWDKWERLERGAALADQPGDAMIALLAAVQMLFATDLQWERFQDAANRKDQPNWSLIWPNEVHFLLIAARAALVRLRFWASLVRDRSASDIVRRLDLKGLDDFRNHQEHLEGRLPSGTQAGKAELSSPGHPGIHVEPGASALLYNGMRDRRFLSFGNEQIDLGAIHDAALAVAEGLVEWLEARSRWPLRASS